jgi:DNA-binding MarR family transcriptional regulator
MQLRRAYLSLHRRANAHFAPFGVTADQFVLLTLLAKEDHVTQQELVGRSASDPNTLRAMLVLLERRGFIERRRHATDGRAWSVVLTKSGRKVQNELWDHAESFHTDLLALFQGSELDSLLGYLNRLSETTTVANFQPTRSQRASV